MNERIWEEWADWHIAAARAWGRDESGPYTLRRVGQTWLRLVGPNLRRSAYNRAPTGAGWMAPIGA